MADRPPVGGYDPLMAPGRPGGKPDAKPRFRPLVHKSDWRAWQDMVQRVGTEKAQQLWDHLAFRADQPPLVGTSTPLKGGHMEGKNGWSRVYHYEVSGPGRIDYQYHDSFRGGRDGDPHGVVQVIDIDMSSH